MNRCHTVPLVVPLDGHSLGRRAPARRPYRHIRTAQPTAHADERLKQRPADRATDVRPKVYGRIEDTVETLVLLLLDPVLKGQGLSALVLRRVVRDRGEW